MKKWLTAFFLGFFSHKASKESGKQGYTNIFLAVALAMVFLWAGFIGGDMLPFATHYNNCPDLQATAHAVFANDDISKRIVAEVKDGDLLVKKHGGDYTEALLVNTFKSQTDKQAYSVNSFDVVVDSRPADTLAEVQAYCISNDGKNMTISYEDYLTLSDVAKLNFDFKLTYTGNALQLTQQDVESYKQHVEGIGEESKSKVQALANDLAQNTITQSQYDRAIYELYFANYYPEITQYESSSKVPLLRNYYYHEYLSKGANNYLLVFDDYIAGSFETTGGLAVTFYGIYSNLQNGIVVAEGSSHADANALVDDFIQKSYNANLFLNTYAHMMNTFTLVPFVALMVLVAALLSHSLLKLLGVDSVGTFGTMAKIIGSFVWFSGLIAALIAVAMGFFVKKSLLTALALVLFFVALIARSIVFVIKENILHKKQLEQQKTEQVGG